MAVIRPDLTKFPPQERVQIFHIGIALDNLEKHKREIWAALALFDTSMNAFSTEQLDLTHQDLMLDWARIACRDTGMTIFHFGKTIEGIRSSFKECPTFRDAVHLNEIRIAYRNLAKQFPVYTKLRNAIGHRAELTKTRSDTKRNSANQIGTEIPGMILEGRSTTITEIIQGRRFFQTFENELLSYEMSAESCGKIDSIFESIKLAFRDVSYS